MGLPISTAECDNLCRNSLSLSAPALHRAPLPACCSIGLTSLITINRWLVLALEEEEKAEAEVCLKTGLLPFCLPALGQLAPLALLGCRQLCACMVFLVCSVLLLSMLR